MQLPTDLSRNGDQLLRFDRLDSTMDEARRQFVAGIAHRTWIVAGEQTAGRGRHGRHWVSPPGNLHMTLLLPTTMPLRDQPKLGFVAGVALARAAESLLPASTTVRLKWPNDLLVNGAKASGLLMEGLGGGAAVAIGIGVNLVAHPPDVPYPATHLGTGITREAFFTCLAAYLTEEIEIFSNGAGFALTRQRWLARAAHLGRPIVIRQGQDASSSAGRLEGIFRDIDGEGRLIIETPAGLTPIAAGDVFPLDK